MTQRFALVLLALALLVPAAAQAKDDGRLEAYGGLYKPNDASSKATYGLRGGVQLTDRWGLEGSVGRFTLTDSGFKFDATLADISFKAYLSQGGPAQVFLFAGPGWAFVNVRGLSARADSFSAHAGAGVDIQVADKLYLRPDVRGRWFQKGTDNKLEWEGSLALGFKF